MGYVELGLRQEGRFRRLYAIKRPLPYLSGDDDFLAMFMDEARVAGLLRHSNIASVLDVGQDDTGPYLAMDYIEGLSALDVIKSYSPASAMLPVWFVLRIAAQVCRGLHAAHELKGDDGTVLNLVHRDVSPQNILIGFDGVARVTDFGIAKAFGNVNRTSTGILKGNIAYMSPEQLRLERPDRRSDLFSLGVVIYEMLARQRLNPRGDDLHRVAQRMLHEAPADIGELRPDVDARLSALLFQLMAKDRSLRPASAMVVAEQLDAIVLQDIEGESFRPDLGAFMAENFAALRTERAATIQAAISALQTAPTKSNALRGAVKARRRLWASSLLAIVGVAALAAAFFLNQAAPPPASVPGNGAKALSSLSPNRAAGEMKAAPFLQPPSVNVGVQKISTKRLVSPVASKPRTVPKSYRDAPIFTKWK